jgi:hypothetical protein
VLFGWEDKAREGAGICCMPWRGGFVEIVLEYDCELSLLASTPGLGFFNGDVLK